MVGFFCWSITRGVEVVRQEGDTTFVRYLFTASLRGSTNLEQLPEGGIEVVMTRNGQPLDLWPDQSPLIQAAIVVMMSKPGIRLEGTEIKTGRKEVIEFVE
jgi:hypothetical protein